MAQYFNLVTNANNAITIEEVQRICSVEGQSVQFVVEDINNGGNGSTQYVTYTPAAQNTDQAIFSPQTINLGGQIATAPLDQRQNVYIIKTSDMSTTQNILKTNTVNVVGENIVNIVDDRGNKIPVNSNPEGQSMQWIKMPENSINFNAVLKQNTTPIRNQVATPNRNQQQNNVTTPLSYQQGQRSLSEAQFCSMEKKTPRQLQNRNRHSFVQGGSVLNTPQGGHTVHSPGDRMLHRNSTSSFQTKAYGLVQTVQQTLKTNPPALHYPEKEHLSERIKQQAKLKRALHTQMRDELSPPHRQYSSALQQRKQQLHQQQHQHCQPSVSPQMKQQRQPLLGTQCANQQAMEIDQSENIEEQASVNQENSNEQAESECKSTESLAYLQKTIHDPHNTIVPQQIEGNTAKMLVLLPDGEQRLITFDIPNDECTVQDLLEQSNISFCGDTVISLVSDGTLGINYIVEAGPGTSMGTPDETEQSSLEVENNSMPNTAADGSSPNFHASNENSNSSVTPNETFYKKTPDRNATAKLDQDGSVCKRGRGRARAVGSSRSKPVKEPECLTISSDEEDEENKIKKSEMDNNVTHNTSSGGASNEEMEMISEKEPVITNNLMYTDIDHTVDGEEGVKGGGRESETEDITDGSIQAPHTSILCRTVRIGSYKYIPRERVVISQNGIRLGVPLLEDDTNFVTLDVKFKSIVKVLIHFGKIMPVLFFYTTPGTGAMIRELLGMQDPKGPYYDPAGKDNTHKRITLLPEEMTEESKLCLKTLFPLTKKLEELNPKEANEILIRSSPQCQTHSETLLKRQSQGSSSNSSNVNGKIQTIMVYPPPPAKGGIAINTEDYACLGEDQFLNDVIIDFYLKYLTLEVLSETDQSRTHVFSSYFYKRLTSPHAQAAENTAPLSAAAKRHARVQKWTKNVNIFEKDFIVIPINEHAHWFLAIICFPGLVGKVPVSTQSSKEHDVHKTVQKSKKVKELKLQAVTIGSTTITPVATTITLDPGDDGSERDEAEGDDEEMEMESDEEEDTENQEDNANRRTKVTQTTAQQKDIVKIPCILIFDSLAGASRSRVVATLRDYLSCEHLAKMGVDKVFSKDTIKGSCPKVPQQSNFTDCGVYVLQYVESFFKDPIKNYMPPIKTLKTWFEEIVVTRKREELSKLLMKLMNATKGDKNINLPTLTFPTQDGKLLPRPEAQTADAATVKTEAENKKPNYNETTENRVTSSEPTTEKNAEQISEARAKISPFIPYSSSASSSSNESNQTDMFTEVKTMTRSDAETMSYLKAKRIPRLMLRSSSESQDDKQSSKKHKGDNFDSCK
ncbi:uncharacterized protein LOC107263491 isoform X2 [Cephus cinctus]|uniref:Uncharacterized protein LOC107263491 isoform X2 n=1 Tax=Cephus cinctus TaxID=211228 RepID=A0AAJ7BHL5_CEPCN|nr:uncharacterized protein LOC107263491 isoform X2 [Cephus cinctus]